MYMYNISRLCKILINSLKGGMRACPTTYAIAQSLMPFGCLLFSFPHRRERNIHSPSSLWVLSCFQTKLADSLHVQASEYAWCMDIDCLVYIAASQRNAPAIMEIKKDLLLQAW